MGNSFKLKDERFKLDGRKKFFAEGILRHWNRLPRTAVDALFKARLDGTTLKWWVTSLPTDQGTLSVAAVQHLHHKH